MAACETICIMEEKEILKIIGSNLRGIRERRNISADEIAEMMGISPDAVRKYERGERDPGIARLIEARNSLHVSMQTMLSGLDEDSKSGTEYNVLSARGSHILRWLATSWAGDIEALIIYIGMIAAMPPEYRREIYMSGDILKDKLISSGIITERDLPPGINYMEKKLGELYENTNG